MDELYILHFKDTPFWPRFNPDNPPDAGRIQEYLTNRGVTFGPNGGVTVGTDGSVFVTSSSDPSGAWPTFNNDPSQTEVVLNQRLQQLTAIRNKMVAGTATQAEKDLALRTLITLTLKEYAQE